MFITNIGKISNKLYECDLKVGAKLIKMGLSPLGRLENNMYFAKTDKLKAALKKIEGGNENE